MDDKKGNKTETELARIGSVVGAIIHDAYDVINLGTTNWIERVQEALESGDIERAKKGAVLAHKGANQGKKILGCFKTLTETGKIQITPEKFDLSYLIDDIVDFHRESIEEGIKIRIRNRRGEYLFQDHRVVYEIYNNLIGNAVECGPGTHIVCKSTMPVNSIDDTQCTKGGKYLKQRIISNIKKPDIGNLGTTSQSIQALLGLIGGECRDEFLTYEERSKGRYQTEVDFTIPLDLRDYKKAL